MLTNGFVQNNLDNTDISFIQMFVTVPVQVRSITGKNKPFQSGSGFKKLYLISIFSLKTAGLRENCDSRAR